MADVIIIAALAIVAFMVIRSQLKKFTKGCCSGCCAGCSGCVGHSAPKDGISKATSKEMEGI